MVSSVEERHTYSILYGRWLGSLFSNDLWSRDWTRRSSLAW